MKVVFIKLIFTAGPWTKDFLVGTDYQQLHYEVWQIPWGSYPIDAAYKGQSPQWFNFQHRQPKDPNQGLFYGFPSRAKTDEGEHYVKVGIDWTSSDLKYPQFSEAITYAPPENLLQIMDDFVSEYLVGVKQRFHAQLSPYTMSSDVQFCLDHLSANVAVFSHGSGQSFKFAPMIGKCLADLTLNTPPPIDLTTWQLKRLMP